VTIWSQLLEAQADELLSAAGQVPGSGQAIGPARPEPA